MTRSSTASRIVVAWRLHDMYTYEYVGHEAVTLFAWTKGPYRYILYRQMSYDSTPRAPRAMVTGNWACGKCGNAITSLPFEPDASRLDSLLCSDCHRERRSSIVERRPRQMVEGNWTCSVCGGAITSLPFQPDPSRVDSLKCINCHRAGRA